MIAPIAVSRGLRAGCRAGKASSCARMSGEALQRIQSTPLSLMAMDDWVRAWPRKVPARRPAQLVQLQFHWGKPPPAAEPRIWMNMEPSPIKAPAEAGAEQSTIGEVHRHFETNTQIAVLGFSPHGSVLSSYGDAGNARQLH